ncbi:hypothetical protein RN001_004437 [Aquatica leii]|uniref:Rhodanese domain-containing protein n=1 Tax=Aquatica leii TaxID=1421715 RepID=A0AAN7QJK1_9COLE|nr:hypothetical protein RN001_004437 [Aquatica leii]
MTSRILRTLCVRSHSLILNINSKCLQTAVFSNMHLRKLKRFDRPPLLSTSTVTINTQQSAMMSGQGIKNIDYQGVKSLKDQNSVLLVDVREPKELQETGVLPNSVNIPLGKLENALKNLSDDEFKKLYGRSKPTLDYPLVFSCKTGGRSKKASELAQKLGYTNVSNYSGGWTDWEKNMKS